MFFVGGLVFSCLVCYVLFKIKQLAPLTSHDKKYIEELKDKGLIDVHFDLSKPKGYLIKTKRGCQLGCH